ncbi:uncharacterized protein LOC117222111 isoform X2 [Megalopta genalis]|uniref:uncharacterized protein LOC117222111 isoform X2 n=1 Tax=Megalopta genalis TaxID=115081 RepID=UPI003FCF23C1
MNAKKRRKNPWRYRGIEAIIKEHVNQEAREDCRLIACFRFTKFAVKKWPDGKIRAQFLSISRRRTAVPRRIDREEIAALRLHGGRTQFTSYR